MTEDNQIVRGAIDHLDDLLTSHESKTILPTSSAIEESTSKIFSTLPHHGYGYSFTANHIIADLTPGLNQASKSSRYYGFVTGGNTPIARLADHYVSLWDQNVAVHLPAESVTTIVEDQALRMLLSLFDLPVDKFPSRTFTTGATASNVLGLACGREYVLQWHADRAGVPYDPHAGLLGSCLAAGIAKIQILTTKPHSSLGKAASVVGLGSGCLVDVSTHSDGLRFDMSRLKRCLEKINTASIVVISCSEVNLGGFATSGLDEVSQIRRLCDKYGAWLHVDAAFGLFAALLPDEPAYRFVKSGVAGIDLADSITSDAHKLLNVPYDTGIFFSRHPTISTTIFSNTNAPYLSSSSSDSIVSPLNLGLENSRRWRALPVYANLIAYGQSGWQDMIVKMVELARAIAKFIIDECEHLEVLFPEAQVHHIASKSIPTSIEGVKDSTSDIERIFIITTFRARDTAANRSLVQRINDDRRIYVSGTMIEGEPAARIAVAKWNVDVQMDLKVVCGVLKSLAY